MKAAKILPSGDIPAEPDDTTDVEIISPAGAAGISTDRESGTPEHNSLQVPQGRQDLTPAKGPVAPYGALDPWTSRSRA